MPSSSLQSRIQAFEALASSPQPSTTTPPSSLSTTTTTTTATTATTAPKPPLRSLPSLLEAPISPSASSVSPIEPSPSRSVPVTLTVRSPSHSPPNLGRKSSLIDLRDWVVDVDGPDNPTARRAASSTSPRARSPTPLIKVVPSKKPPLPPRKPSNPSLRPVPSLPALRSVSAGGEPHPTLRPDSFVGATQHTYPPSRPSTSASLRSPTPRRATPGHVQGSSVSSFHSVSLSSDGGAADSPLYASPPADADREGSVSGSVSADADIISLDESFETVEPPSASVSPSTSPSAAFTRGRPPGPPKLPQRPDSSKSSVGSSSTSISTAASHSTTSTSGSTATGSRMPPPPRPASAATPSLHPPHAPPPPRRVSRSPSASAGESSSTATGGTSNTAARRPPPHPPLYTARPGPSRPQIPPRGNGSAGVPNATAAVLAALASKGKPSKGSPSLSSRTSSRAPQLERAPPIPAAARARYERLFDANIAAMKKNAGLGTGSMVATSVKKRSAAGWRGMSVDLISGLAEETTPGGGEEGAKGNLEEKVTADPTDGASIRSVGVVAAAKEKWEGGAVQNNGHSGGEETTAAKSCREESFVAGSGSEERLDGQMVAILWAASRLDRRTLRGIWKECDPKRTGSLDRAGFVKGMWRIDEELRRVQVAKRANASSSSSLSLPLSLSGQVKGSRGTRYPPAPRQRPQTRPILR